MCRELGVRSGGACPGPERRRTRAAPVLALAGGTLLLALIMLGLDARPVAAAPPAPGSQGVLVLETRAAGDGGLQMDAVAVSPQPAPAGAPLVITQTYTTQPGDTLSGIAVRLGMDPAALAAQNKLADTDRLQAGQVLIAGGRMLPAPALPAGGVWQRAQFWPWPPAQGQTVLVWLQTAVPLSITATFAGNPYPDVSAGRRSWMLLPVPALQPLGPQALVLVAGGTTFTLTLPVVAGVFQSEEVPASTADPILSEAAKVNAEETRVAVLLAGESLGDWTLRSRFRSPVPRDLPHTSPFGTRRIYGSSPNPGYHAGEDFAADPGTPVLAPAAGRVILAERLFVRGNAVILDHGNGVFSGYWHMQKLDVAAGDHVVAGQELGEVGTTGMSTGPHLHWELRIDGVAVDPLQWLEP